MKILTLTLLLIATIYGAKIDEFAAKAGYQRDYQTALEMAKKQNKDIMLLVVADYCPWCKKFEKKTLLNASVKKIVDANFIPLVIDKLKEKGSFPKEYGVPLIPAVFFIDPSTQKANHDTLAYMSKREFKENLDIAMSKSKQKAE